MPLADFIEDVSSFWSSKDASYKSLLSDSYDETTFTKLLNVVTDLSVDQRLGLPHGSSQAAFIRKLHVKVLLAHSIYHPSLMMRYGSPGERWHAFPAIFAVLSFVFERTNPPDWLFC